MTFRIFTAGKYGTLSVLNVGDAVGVDEVKARVRESNAATVAEWLESPPQPGEFVALDEATVAVCVKSKA